MTDVDSRPPTAARHQRRNLWIAIAVVVVIGAGVGLALFQPWRIFTRSTVDEALPVAVAGQGGSVTSAMVTEPGSTTTAGAEVTTSEVVVPEAVVSPAIEAPATAPTATPDVPAVSATQAEEAAEAPAVAPAENEPTVLAAGTFVDGEHSTSGTASILRLPDGSRFVRLEGFSTSDGPDVDVWITDQQAGGEDWGKYDDGRYLTLGDLKGTDGNQNYPIPTDADLSGLTSIVIWCDRFNVAFGTAAITM